MLTAVTSAGRVAESIAIGMHTLHAPVHNRNAVIPY